VKKQPDAPEAIADDDVNATPSAENPFENDGANSTNTSEEELNKKKSKTKE
jgi:hypothetical protein